MADLGIRHDLCGRMYPTSVFTNPFCHALGVAYGCGLCAGPGFVGCAGPGYTLTFRHSYAYQEDCIPTTCVDLPGDCFDDCSGACWVGCDVDGDCFDDCSNEYACGTCVRDENGTGLEARVGEYTVTWPSDEIDALAGPLEALAASTPDREQSRGVSLRALVHDELSEGARVTALTGNGAARIDIAGTAWNGTGRDPVLIVEEDGRLDFQWLGAGSKLPGLEACGRSTS